MKFMGIDLGDVKSTLSNVGNWNNVVQQFDSLKKKNDVLEDDIIAHQKTPSLQYQNNDQ